MYNTEKVNNNLFLLWKLINAHISHAFHIKSSFYSGQLRSGLWSSFTASLSSSYISMAKNDFPKTVFQFQYTKNCQFYSIFFILVILALLTFMDANCKCRHQWRRCKGSPPGDSRRSPNHCRCPQDQSSTSRFVGSSRVRYRRHVHSHQGPWRKPSQLFPRWHPGSELMSSF